jgi:3-oxoacyl-[acyl-carrier-protein] synthase III
VIESLGVYLPSRVVTTEEILLGCGLAHLPLERVTGIRSRRVAGETEFSIDLARRAIEICLRRSRHGAHDIDLVLACNLSRYDRPGFTFSFEPSTACRLQADFGFDDALAFDIGNGCAGFFTGIAIVDLLIRCGVVRRGLVVSGEYISHLTQTAQKEINDPRDPRIACLTVGDAGAAVILQGVEDDESGFHEIKLETSGGYSSLCVARPTDGPHGGAIMLTDAGQLADVGMRQGMAHALGVLNAAGWSPDTLAHVIPHQTSRASLASATRLIDRFLGPHSLRRDLLIDNLSDRGNTATTSHFVTLWDSIFDERIRAGDRVAFSIIGAGLTIGTALYVFDDLPDRLRGGDGAPFDSGAGAVRPAEERGRTLVDTGRIRIAGVGVADAGGAEGTTSLDLATEAVESCLRQTGLTSEDVDLYIYAGVYRSGYEVEPAAAAQLVGRLEHGKKTAGNPLAFDILNGAVGFLNACWVAGQLIRGRTARRAIVVAAEAGDAGGAAGDPLRLRDVGSAVLLERAEEGADGFGSYSFRSFPEHLDAYVVDGRLCNNRVEMVATIDPRLHDYYLAHSCQVVEAMLTREGLDRSRIAVVVPPQFSAEFNRQLADRLSISHQCFMTIDDGQEGDLYSSAFAFAWQRALDGFTAKSGDVALIISVAAGIQVGCALYHFA